MNRTLLLLPVLALAVGCKSYSERAEERTYKPYYYTQAMPQGRMVVGHSPGHYDTTCEPGDKDTVRVAPGQYRVYSYTNLRDSWGNPVLSGTSEPVGAIGEDYEVTTGNEWSTPDHYITAPPGDRDRFITTPPEGKSAPVEIEPIPDESKPEQQ